MQGAFRVGLIAALMSLPASVVADNAALKFAPAQITEFQPHAQEKYPIGFTLTRPGRVTLTVYSADNDRVRVLVRDQHFAAGTHEVSWDGRDDAGRVVPNEAYHPVLTCNCDGKSEIVDARRVSGGVVIDKLRPELSSDGTLTFDLPSPSRTLVRLGIKGGAMMRALDAWSPRSAGRVRLTWDGLDQSGVARLLGEPGLTVLVTAFTLPEQTIITSGNTSFDYIAYRQQRKWPTPVADGKHGALERNGQRLSRQALLPRTLLADPRVTLSVVDKLPRTAAGAWKVSGPVTLKVDMPPQDKWLVQQSLYEVGFFLDYQFVSEEETGYTPLTWRWDPAGVPAGEHVMTVNISGFWGQVGAASIRLAVSEK